MGMRTEHQNTASVIVPVFNEEKNLRELHGELMRAMSSTAMSFEILYVNDGSSDGSGSVLEDLAKESSCVRIIEFRRNFGQTAALDAGIQMAEGNILIMLDADLQNDPADIPAMLREIAKGYDLVQGWRKNRYDAFLSRRLPSIIANALIARVTSNTFHDIGCSLKVIRREIISDIQIYGEMHRFIPILAYWHGARCLETVTHHRPRLRGTSKYGIGRTLSVILDLITVKFIIHYLKNPMRLFGGMGLLCFFTGILSGSATLAMKLLDDQSINRNPLFYLTILLIIISVQFFFIGMIGELLMRIYFESKRKYAYAVRRTIHFPNSDDAIPHPAR